MYDIYIYIEREREIDFTLTCAWLLLVAQGNCWLSHNRQSGVGQKHGAFHSRNPPVCLLCPVIAFLGCRTTRVGGRPHPVGKCRCYDYAKSLLLASKAVENWRVVHVGRRDWPSG